MRKLLFLIPLILIASLAYGQGSRFGDGQSITSAQTSGGPIFTVPNAGISFCTYPANAVPCTNKATTYTDITLGTSCSTSTQITLVGSTSCVGTTDAYGNWGVWVAAGTYSFTIQLPTGGYVGPYVVTLASGGSTGVASLNALTGAVTVAGSSSVTVTPSGNTLTLTSSAPASAALKASIYDGTQNGSPNPAVPGDGLSVGSAKASIMDEFDALPSASYGGTLNLYSGGFGVGNGPLSITNASCTNQTWWLINTGDPNYGAPGICQRVTKNALAIIGQSAAQATFNQWGGAATTIMNSVPAGSGPAIGISGGGGYSLKNLQIQYPSQFLTIGKDSNGGHACAPTSNVVIDDVYSSIQFSGADAAKGPNVFIGCFVNFLSAHRDFFGGNDAARVDSDNRSGIVIHPNYFSTPGTLEASGLLDFNEITSSAGGAALRIYDDGNGVANIAGDFLVSEGSAHCQAAVEVLYNGFALNSFGHVGAIDCGANSVSATFASGNPSWNSIYNTFGPIIGPSTIYGSHVFEMLGNTEYESDGIPIPIVNGAAMNQKGHDDNRELDDVSDVWRSGAPTVPVYANLAPIASGSWTVSPGSCSFGAIADPYGGTNATRITCTSGCPCTIYFLKANNNFAPGDYLYHSLLVRPGYAGAMMNLTNVGINFPFAGVITTSFRFVAGNPDFSLGSGGDFGTASTQTETWQRMWGVMQNSSIALVAVDPAFFITIQQAGTPMDVYMPMYEIIPATSVTRLAPCTATASPSGQVATNSTFGPGAFVAVTTSGACPVTIGGQIIVSGSTNSSYDTTNNYTTIDGVPNTGGGGGVGTVYSQADSTHFVYWINGTGLAASGGGTITVANDSEIADVSRTMPLYPSTAILSKVNSPLALIAPTYGTLTNCGAVGTGANPSLVACGSAPAGAFSCATAASTGTCVISTTAVTASSEIFVQQAVSEGTRLSVTCNTASVLPTTPLLLSKSAGTSFTITLGTVTTNPGCFVYHIVN